MATLLLERLSKTYGDVRAVDDVNLTINDGEFITFLGPSGCGKTTLLRMIAGFVHPTTGSIRLGERVLVSVKDGIYSPTEQRGMGMVFQSYAVWPHMNVSDNVAYPLKFKKWSRTEKTTRLQHALELVRLKGLETRYPHQLSGGQQQRVALARALVMEPAVLLLDEPLSNLDARLREEMRDELVELRHRLPITIVYVTHDQIEAMAMSDRVVVMRQGRVLQVASPHEIYDAPSTVSVADFVGHANFIRCRVEALDDTHCHVLLLDHNVRLALARGLGPMQVGDERVLMVRPEHIGLNTEESGLVGTAHRKTFLGNRVIYEISLGKMTLRVEAPTSLQIDEGKPVRLSFTHTILLREES
jgi:iron(III) transport system ATP-binding protein